MENASLATYSTVTVQGSASLGKDGMLSKHHAEVVDNARKPFLLLQCLQGTFVADGRNDRHMQKKMATRRPESAMFTEHIGQARS